MTMTKAVYGKKAFIVVSGSRELEFIMVGTT